MNSPFSMQVIRLFLSSTVLRRAAAGRPFPLLDTMTVLVPQRTLPLEEMLDSEAQRRRGSSRRGEGEVSSSSTTKPFAIPVPRRLIGDSSSSSPSALLLRVLFFGKRSVSRRGITTDRKVLAPRGGGDTADASGVLGGFCGLALLDLRKRTLFRRLQAPEASVRRSLSGSSGSGVCPLIASWGTEVDMLVSLSSSMGVWSALGLTGFRGGGSELLGEVSSCGGEVNGSNVGGGKDFSCAVEGSVGGSGSGFSSGSAGAGSGSGAAAAGGGGGSDFFRLISLRTSMMVFFSSLSLLLRDGLCFIAVLRSNFSSSSFS